MEKSKSPLKAMASTCQIYDLCCFAHFFVYLLTQSFIPDFLCYILPNITLFCQLKNILILFEHYRVNNFPMAHFALDLV